MRTQIPVSVLTVLTGDECIQPGGRNECVRARSERRIRFQVILEYEAVQPKERPRLNSLRALPHKGLVIGNERSRKVADCRSLGLYCCGITGRWRGRPELRRRAQQNRAPVSGG